MYGWLHSRIHKDIDTSDDRDRLNSQRHVLVQAAVTTQLCHHTCHLPQRQRKGNQTSHLGRGTNNPRNQSDCNISPRSTTSRRQDGLNSRCNTTANSSRPKRCATMPAGKTDPMGARVLYSEKAPAGGENRPRMCLKELETARTCDQAERALIKTRAQPGATTSMGTRWPRSCVTRRKLQTPGNAEEHKSQIMCNHIAYPHCQQFVLPLPYRHMTLLLKEHLLKSGHNLPACQCARWSKRYKISLSINRCISV